jgi:hypothetical protein
VASNPSQIPAGGKDKISVVINTQNRGGEMLRKRFTVTTNDPKNPSVDLSVFGMVKGFVEINPNFVRLMGTKGEKISATVKIVPQPTFPFKIVTAKATQGEYITQSIKALGKNPERDGYELTVTNTMKEPGNYRDYIQIDTDLKEKPTIRIPVSGRVLEPEGGAKGKKTN